MDTARKATEDFRRVGVAKKTLIARRNIVTTKRKAQTAKTSILLSKNFQNKHKEWQIRKEKYKRNLTFLEGRKIIVSYMKADTYANVAQRASTIIKKNNTIHQELLTIGEIR